MTEAEMPEKHFDILYKTLCDIQDGLLDATPKVAGFLLVATGWLATSNDAKTLLDGNPVARHLTVWALAGAFVLYVGAALNGYLISEKTFDLLKRLNYMPVEYYESRRVDLKLFLLFCGGNFFLALLAGGLALKIK